MTAATPDTDAKGLTSLVALRDYSAPSGEAVGVLREMFRPEIKSAGNFLDSVFKRKPKAAAEMFPLSEDEISTLAPEPVGRAYIPELEEAYGSWLDGDKDEDKTSLKVLVYPPGDMDTAMSFWAQERGLQCVAATDRHTEIALPRDGSAIVVPALHKHFLRQVGGLNVLMKFLVSLMDHNGKVLLGCNSWAWSYLKAAANVESLLPFPEAFKPLDAEAMQAWLHVSGANVVLHDRQSQRDTFKDLSIRSQGIPSVAWQMWRQGLRQETDGTVVLSVVPDLRGLPDDQRQARLVLQALLVHGGLKTAELNSLMPFGTAAEMAVALERRGYVDISGSVVSVCPLAYPTVRSLLLTAGFNSDDLS